jgi:hypothetical protein
MFAAKVDEFSPVGSGRDNFVAQSRQHNAKIISHIRFIVGNSDA